MGTRIFVALAVLMLAPRLTASARADSDGYYCVGPNWPPQRNLGGWSRPVGTLQVERIPLPASAGTSVVLEIVPRRALERCMTLIKTRVVVSDSSGQLGELTVFEGHGRRACGENHERGSKE
jgi:hypothetical protein